MNEMQRRSGGPSDTRAPRPPVPAGDPVPKRPRDLRLDFFRGLAMFIILIAHVPNDIWALWIPARFGFSDATEIFVFCSGFASALAFGAVFTGRSFWLGAARIVFRVWQVYWAHIGVVLFTAAMLFAIDHFGVGARNHAYITEPYLVPLFEDTGRALLGLLSLTYVPGLFDILPMYLVILAMVPAVMLAHRIGGSRAALGLVALTWFGATLAGYAHQYADAPDLAGWQQPLVSAGRSLSWMALPAAPGTTAIWYFNPFAWQLVFFTGFAFGMGWLPAPPVRRWLIRLAVAILLLSVPLSWHKIHGEFSLIDGTGLYAGIVATRDFLEPLWWKSWQGLGRWVHFLALAYLAWVWVGPGGVRLTTGFSPLPALRGVALWLTGAVALVTAPVGWSSEIDMVLPGTLDWLGDTVGLSFNQFGMVQLLHLVSLLALVWAWIGPRGRGYTTRDAVLRAVPVIRKVGTQSLAVFMVSIPLSQAMGWALDWTGRNATTVAAINLAGFGILVAVAYVVSWTKSQPWRTPRAATPAHGPANHANTAALRG